jgi:hypothetical protein
LTVIGQLIKKLPNISFTFSISQHTPNAQLIRQAFEDAGFVCREQINYSQPPEEVMGRLGPKLREHIKQARSKLDIIDIDPSKFVPLYENNLRASDNKRCYFPLEVAKELIAVGMKREPPQARIIAVSRKKSEQSPERAIIDAAICIVWDNERCYYWLSTRRNESHPDAIKLLIVTAMKHAENLGLLFDADGVDTPGTQRLFETIFRMPIEEKRYILTRTSIILQLYETQRSRIEKIKKIAI